MAHQIKKNLGVTLRSDGVEFRVWAPFAQSVELTGTFSEESPITMNSEQDGYWSVFVEDALPGQQFRYRIDTGKEILLRNDPRSRAITSSDNGFSIITQNDFDWGDHIYTPPPKNEQIIYELHIGTFNRVDASTPGTFDTAIEQLDYLKSLGVTTIEVMPITSMAFGNGWGYAPNYLYSVESAYGGRHGFMKFISACHDRNMGVILDVVYNHFFPETDLWQFDGWSENNRGGIYFYNDERGDTPWGGRPDYGRTEVRQFILDNVTMWLTEYKLDGLRIDSTIYMRNTEGRDNDPTHDIPEAWQLLQDIVELSHKINPDSFIIAEDASATAFITKARIENGCGFDAQWELGFPHVIRDALGITQNIAPTLTGINYELTREYNGDAFEKIIFSDSHDTAANGSVRLNEAVTPENATSLAARQKTLVASSLMLTAPGVPMLLQGSEFLQDGSFNDWRELEWEKVEKYHGIVEAHRHLIDLRLNRHGNTQGLLGQHTAIFHQDDTNFVIGYHRWDKGGPLDDTIVLINFSNRKLEEYSLRLPRPGTWYIRFNSSWKGYSADFKEYSLNSCVTDVDNTVHVTLPAYGVYILSQEL